MKALQSLSDGSLSGRREQTICTGRDVLGPLLSVWGRIAFDPTYATGALTNPEEKLELDWGEIWESALDLAAWESDEPELVVALLRSKIRAGDVSAEIRAAAKLVRRELRTTYRGREALTVVWRDRTFINSPFGDKGPECLFGGYRQFLEKFEKTKSELALLGPVRPHRKWWRRVARSCTTIYLNPIQFIGYKSTFPAPCALMYKGHRSGEIVQAFAAIGEPV